MAAANWGIHPGTVIAHHAGHFLAVRLSCSERPIPITLPDFVLLAQFRTAASPARAVAEFMDGSDTRFLPGRPVPSLVMQRLQQLQQHGVLVTADEPMGETPGTALGRAAAAGTAVRESSVFRLSRNFALRPRRHGFDIYSAATGRTYSLDLELALLLMGFANGRTAAQVAGSHRPAIPVARLREIAAWLAAEGLLIPVRESSAAAGDYRKQVPLRRARGLGWRDLQPDGRIPVYFMPHMENHFPLALGMIYSALASWKAGALRERFQLVPISYLPPREFLQGPYRKFGRGVWLFSNYMWSLQLNVQVSAAVKQHDARNLTIHGGPSTPSYEQACADFMRRHPSVDIAVHGEGEVTTCQLLEAIEPDAAGALRPGDSMADVAGLSIRRPGAEAGELLRTAPRTRMGRPDVIPSPYAEGVFDTYEARVEAAIVETNRGCPFKCTFCDWGSATNQKIMKFDLDRIQAELDWIGRNRIGVLWIADANFGMLKRDLEIARWIIDIKRRYGYPREVVVNYTKNANERLAEIIKVFTEGGIISQGIISIQTTDEKTLAIIDRANIKTEKYDQLIEIFSDLGLPLSTDLMIGLPGITPEAFDRDLQRYIDVDVSVKAYPTQLLPNSPMAHPDYIRKYRIEVDADNYLVSCSSYTAQELRQMNLIYQAYTVTDGYGTLRHVMRFLQWEHGIRAIDFIHELTDLAYATPDRFPAISWVIRQFSAEKCIPGGWKQFYDEIAALVEASYGIHRDSAFDVVLQVNEAVMPDDARHYPLSVELQHDFVSYFAAHNRRRKTSITPLRAYPPGRLTVSDPNGMAHIDVEYQQYDTHQFFWELHAPVSRAKSITNVSSRKAASPVAV
ncbi:MAG TPA: radical SAM protein [Gammaproteobacteria bacterium]|nr:radical SAM protein [Gammaproteobacteria bacterium]